MAQAFTLEIIFVDDGSRDGTYQALTDAFSGQQHERISFRFERHTTNRGLGAAMRTGFAAASADLIVTTDCDGTYKFAEIPSLLDGLKSDVDMVTASPYHPAGHVAGVPAYRLLLSRGSSLIYRVLVNWHVYTYTALFRVYRRRVIEQAPFESDGFLAGAELLVNALLMGYHVAEYPTVLHARVFGTSKAKLARTIRAHLKFQLRVLLHRLNVLPLVERGPNLSGRTLA